jgi:hypothetical protein
MEVAIRHPVQNSGIKEQRQSDDEFTYFAGTQCNVKLDFHVIDYHTLVE